MYRNILVPLDGSLLAERALPYARLLAHASGAKLTLVRAVEAPGLNETATPDDQDKAFADAEGYLAGLAVAPTADGKIVTGVYRDDAMHTIVAESRSREADLIVMSTHGRSGLSRSIYGSVAEGVLRNVDVPVLLIGAASEHVWMEGRRARILIPLDGSDLAVEVLRPALDLAGLLGAELHLLRVIPPPEYIHVEGYPDMPAGEYFAVSDERQAADYLETIARDLRSNGQAVASSVESGDPVLTILRVAREKEGDAIAIATHGRTGIARLLMGSVATGIVQRAPVPILLVRPTAIARARDRAEEQPISPQMA